MENRVKEGLKDLQAYLQGKQDGYKILLQAECTPEFIGNAQRNEGYLQTVNSLLAALENPGEDEKLLNNVLCYLFPSEERDDVFAALSRVILRAKLTDEERVKIKREMLGHFRAALQVEPDMFDYIDRQLAALGKKEAAR